jgi:hypothetical protein
LISRPTRNYDGFRSPDHRRAQRATWRLRSFKQASLIKSGAIQKLSPNSYSAWRTSSLSLRPRAADNEFATSIPTFTLAESRFHMRDVGNQVLVSLK